MLFICRKIYLALGKLISSNHTESRALLSKFPSPVGAEVVSK